MVPLLRKLRLDHSAVRFIIVGGLASAAHWCVSWVVYYHILNGMTILSTLSGYTIGWFLSFFGNRLWSFRCSAEVPVMRSAVRFVNCQLLTAVLLLCATWCMQMMIIFYFRWYIYTNDVDNTPELLCFCRGASYPPALLFGMAVAALASYLLMKRYVFSLPQRSST
ncbi:MAG: GtrA family protein [Akkermansia sp.]